MSNKTGIDMPTEITRIKCSFSKIGVTYYGAQVWFWYPKEQKIRTPRGRNVTHRVKHWDYV